MSHTSRRGDEKRGVVSAPSTTTARPAIMTSDALAKVIRRLPRVKLANLPTPIHDCVRLSESLKGPRILVKRDDLTGLALGGNKTRNLEFILGEALQQGVDSYIAIGSVQSNACRQVAAAGAQLGLDVHLVLKTGVHNEKQGNRLLDSMFGASVRVVEDGDQPGGYDMGAVNREVERLVARLRADGRKPGVYPAACSSEIAAAGYLNAVLEIEQQLAAMRARPTHVVVVSGSGSTHAALTVAVHALNLPYKVIGISIRKPRTEVIRDVSDFATRVAKYFGVPASISPDDVLTYDEYRGRGYAIPTTECLSAIDLVARREGILLDPVYTGKAMAGLVDLVNRHVITREHTVLFVHTGGVPAIFAYSDEITQNMSKSVLTGGT